MYTAVSVRLAVVHAIPPFVPFVSIVRVRVIVLPTPPHVAEHAPYEPHAL